MTKFSNGLVTVFSFTAAFSASGNALAGEPISKHGLKPLAAIAFDAGQKRGVGYFVGEKQQCKLVLTMSDANAETSDFSVTRYETAIPAGSSTKYDTSAGKALEFTCLAKAQAMSVREVERVVSKSVQ